MWSGYALRNIAWREQIEQQQQQQEGQHSQGAPDAGNANAAVGKGASKPHAAEAQAPVRSSSRHQSSSTTSAKKTSTTSSALSKPRPGVAVGRTGQQQRVHAPVQRRLNPHPHPHPTWNAAVGTAATGSTTTLPVTINLSVTLAGASQLTNDSMIVSCATSGDGATGSKENSPNQEDAPQGQTSDSSGSGKTLSSNSQMTSSDGLQVPPGQKSLSSGSQGTSRSRGPLQRACLPTAILHPALGGGPSEYTRRRFEEMIEKEKTEAEASGQVSIWTRARQEREAAGSLFASMSPFGGPPSLHFDPNQRVVSHDSRWQRAPPPPPLAEPVAQPQLVAAVKSGPNPARGGVKKSPDQATERAEIAKTLDSEISRKRTELEELDAALKIRRAERDALEAALESGRTLLEVVNQDFQRCLDDAREADHAIRDDIRKEHSEAMSSLTKLVEDEINSFISALQSIQTDIINDLLKDILPFIEKFCQERLADFCTQEERAGEVVEPAGEMRGISSATASAIGLPAPCDRATLRHSPNAGHVHSKPSASEDATVKPSRRPTSSTARSRNRKPVSSPPKTDSTRGLTPTESKTGRKTSPSKPSAPGPKTVKSRPENAIDSQVRPTRAKTATKQPPFTSLRISTGSSTKSTVAVQNPTTNAPTRPSHKSGPVKRPLKVASGADLPFRKKKRGTHPPRKRLMWSVDDDAKAAFM